MDRVSYISYDMIVKINLLYAPDLVLSTKSLRDVSMLHLMRFEIIWKKRTNLPHCSLRLAKALIPLIRVSRIFSKSIFCMSYLAMSASTFPSSSLLSFSVLVEESYRSWEYLSISLAVSTPFCAFCITASTTLKGK